MKESGSPSAGFTVRALTLLVILCVAGSAGGGQAAANDTTTGSSSGRASVDMPANPAERNPLAGTGWRLVEFDSLDDSTGTVRLQAPWLYTMRLNTDGTVHLRLNCNRATGTWLAVPGDYGTKGLFEFGPLTLTRAICSPPSVDESVAAHAKSVRSYMLRDGKLYLSPEEGGGIYAWEPDSEGTFDSARPAAPEDGGPRNWEVIGVSSNLNLREEPSVSARILTSYAPGTILDNLGIKEAGGRFWCDVQELGGGPRGYVAAEFLKPAVSPDGSVATGPDDSALRAGQGDFDATGSVSCAQMAGQPMRHCEFGVARAGGGYATVVVKRPDGRSRAIFFRMGQPIGADTSEADGYPAFRAVKEGDLHLIFLGQERYEIPDAVILGG